MANILKMAKIHAIIGLLENKWTYRGIARELGATGRRLPVMTGYGRTGSQNPPL